jgi:hypothetical protein
MSLEEIYSENIEIINNLNTYKSEIYLLINNLLPIPSMEKIIDLQENIDLITIETNEIESKLKDYIESKHTSSRPAQASSSTASLRQALRPAPAHTSSIPSPSRQTQAPSTSTSTASSRQTQTQALSSTALPTPLRPPQAHTSSIPSPSRQTQAPSTSTSTASSRQTQTQALSSTALPTPLRPPQAHTSSSSTASSRPVPASALISTTTEHKYLPKLNKTEYDALPDALKKIFTTDVEHNIKQINSKPTMNIFKRIHTIDNMEQFLSNYPHLREYNK